jgi:glutaredoxin
MFVADGCWHCKRVEAELKAHMLPYTKVNITKYPSKRKDMMSLTMQLSTPQVFFNTRHVGGDDETMALLQEWDESCNDGSASSTSTSSTAASSSTSSTTASAGIKSTTRRVPRRSSLRSKRHAYGSVLERYMTEVGLHPDPMDKRFAIPDTLPNKPEPSPPRIKSEIHCLRVKKDTTSTVLEMTQLLVGRKDLICDNQAGGVLYKQSFFGHQVIGAVRDALVLTNKEAASLVQQLLNLQVIQPLQEMNQDMQSLDRSLLYRVYCHHTPDILNSYRVWIERTDSDGMRLLNRLFDMMQRIEMKVTNDVGHRDMEKALQLPEYHAFEESICELQVTEPSKARDIYLYSLAVYV